MTKGIQSNQLSPGGWPALLVTVILGLSIHSAVGILGTQHSCDQINLSEGNSMLSMLLSPSIASIPATVAAW